jgi:ariadne-1
MNDSYAIRTPVSAVRTATRTSTPRGSFFSSSTRRPAPAPAPVPVARPVRPALPQQVVTSSTMAGLSRDGRKVGQNRVGTWLTHVQIDPEATNTAAQDVEVDDWRCDGTMIGID